MEFPESIQNAASSLAQDLVREDDLGAVIRAHIRIENILKKIVDISLVEPKQIKEMNLEYSQMVCLGVALGMIDHKLAPSLKSLGKLRNDFAHEIETELNKNKIDCIYDQLGPKEKQQVQDLSKSLWLSHKPNERYPRFAGLTPRDQFISISIVLWARLNALLLTLQVGSRDA